MQKRLKSKYTARLRRKARSLRRRIPALLLALRDPETPWYAKLLAGITVCYALSPVDLIPDFLPVLGQLDDLLLLPVLVACTVRCIPVSVYRRCLRQAAMDAGGCTPAKRWFYALPAVLVWALLALWLYKGLAGCLWAR